MFRKDSAGSMLSTVLAAMVFTGLVFSCSNAQSTQKAASSKTSTSPSVPKSVAVDSAKTTPPKESRHLVVYYFHGNARCATCLKLEGFAKSEVETAFAAAIKAGTVEWKTVNIETPGDEHYSQDYKLYTKSVIISIRQDGKESSWKNLDKIWELVRDEPKYRDYIRKEVTACLNGACL